VIDWVTCEFPLLHYPLNGGYVCKISPNGESEWVTPCRVQVKGSHEASISVRSLGGDGEGRATTLQFSGNPSKFLQGHNVFGSDDLLSLMYDVFLFLCRHFELNPQLTDLNAIKVGRYALSMIDINYSFELPTRSDVCAWIRSAEFKSRTRHGRPQLKGGTLYWGKTSRRWALKVYSKGEEIEASKHGLPESLQETPIKRWADNKLRLELRLMKKQLTQHGIQEAWQITEATVKSLFNEYVRKIEMKGQVSLSTAKRLSLPQKIQSTYILWQNGEDLRSTLPRATYYRHRKELLDYGIDIALARDQKAEHGANVIPLVRVLEASPAVIPQWAFEQRLVHHSAR